MKFSRKDGKRRLQSWLFMLLAVMCATAMWYVVRVRDRIEAQIEINIDYIGIPPNLIVTNGLVNKITVRLRGPETLLRSIPRQRLTETIDLSSIKRGTTIVPLPNDQLTPALRAFEVVDIQPPRIVVTAETISERSVPIKPIPDSPLGGDALTVENLTVSPATVILRGPESALADKSEIELTIPVDPKAAGTVVQQTFPLDTPSLVTATPSAVRVRYTITSGRTVVTHQCRIRIEEDSVHTYTLTPRDVIVTVELPEALAKSRTYLNSLVASITPPPMEAGESRRVKIRFKMPEGMSMLRADTDEVIVERIKK